MKLPRSTGRLGLLSGAGGQAQSVHLYRRQSALFSLARYSPAAKRPLYPIRQRQWPDAGYSRALEYVLDQTNKTATLVWEYRNTPDVFALGMGNVQRLPNGNTMIGWGTAVPTLTEVMPDGRKAFELTMDCNTSELSRVSVYLGGRPSWLPTLVAVREGGSTRLVTS